MLGAVMGLLLLWVGANLFPDVEVIYLLMGAALFVALIIWVANKIIFTKKKGFKPGSK